MKAGNPARSLGWTASRPLFLLSIVTAYLLPLGIILYMAMQGVSPSLFWTLTTSGAASIFLGTGVLYLLTMFWEAASPKSVVEQVVAPHNQIDEEDFLERHQEFDAMQRKVAMLSHDVFVKDEHIRQLEEEREQWQRQLDEGQHVQNTQQRALQDEIDRLNRLLHESKGMIGEQRAAMELNLERVSQLESKNDDLRYEIKTLLQVTQNSLKLDIEPMDPEGIKADLVPYLAPYTKSRDAIVIPDRPVRTNDEATQELRRCLEITQKFSGSAAVAGSASRYKNAPSGGFALDMRQLFEALRQEQAAMIMFYSWNESKPLFVNAAVKTLLGWTPETFIQNFSEIIADGIQEWRHSLSDLRTKGETLARLTLKDRTGADLVVHCLLGRVQNGQFKNHILAVFYPGS